MKKVIFIASVLLNAILILFLTYKSGIFKNEVSKNFVNPYYQQRTTLFNYLQIDSTDIVMIGNSITQRGEWHELLNNNNVKNRGIGSDDTKGVLGRIENIVNGKPNKVFLMLGVNDIAMGIHPDTTMLNYKKIINYFKVHSPNTHIYVQSILPINSDLYKGNVSNDKVEFLNNKIKKLDGVTYINLYPEFLENGSLKRSVTDDGIHLLGEGYILWRNIINKYVN